MFGTRSPINITIHDKTPFDPPGSNSVPIDYFDRIRQFLADDKKSAAENSLMFNKTFALDHINLLENKELTKPERKLARPIVELTVNYLECTDSTLYKIDKVLEKIFPKLCQPLDDVIALSHPSKNLNILAKRLANNPIAIRHFLIKGSQELLSALLEQKFPLFSWLSDSPASIVILLTKLKPQEYQYIPPDILHFAVTYGCLGIIRELLHSDKVAPEQLSLWMAPNSRGETPLHLAANTSHLEMLFLLLNCPPHLLKGMLQGNSEGMTPLHMASSHNNPQTVELIVRTLTQLLKAGKLQSEDFCSLLTVDNKGYTPLTWAAEHHHREVVHTLINEGILSPQQLAILFTANPTTGATALHIAAFKDIAEKHINPDTPSLLLQMIPYASEDVLMAQDNTGSTFLIMIAATTHFSLFTQCMELVKTKIVSPALQAQFLDICLRTFNDIQKVKPLFMDFWERDPRGFLHAAAKYKERILPFLITEKKDEIKGILSSTPPHEPSIDEADRKNISDRITNIEENWDYFNRRFSPLTPIMSPSKGLWWEGNMQYDDLNIKVQGNENGYRFTILTGKRGLKYDFWIDSQRQDLRIIISKACATYVLDTTPTHENISTLSLAATAVPTVENVDLSMLRTFFETTDFRGYGSTLTDAKITVEKIGEGIDRLLKAFHEYFVEHQHVHYQGISNTEPERCEYFTDVRARLTHIIKALEAPENKSWIPEVLCHLAVGAQLCGTRWKDEAYTYYRLFCSPPVELKEADVDQYMQLCADRLKDEILGKIILGESQTGHARFAYMRALKRGGVLFPDHKIADYDDVYGGMKKKSDEQVVLEFKKLFKTTILTIYWQKELTAIMGDLSKIENRELGAKVQALLIAGTKNILLDHYPAEKKEVEALTKTLNTTQEKLADITQNPSDKEDGGRELRREIKMLNRKIHQQLWNILELEKLATEDANLLVLNGVTFKGALLLGLQTGLLQISSQENFDALFRDLFPMQIN